MHWFVVDETNKNSTPGEFFIIGGLVLTEPQIEEVHDAVEDIRQRHGYRPGDKLKFQSSSRPDHVPIASARDAKKDVITALNRLQVRMITYVLLHDIGKNMNEQARMEWGLNTVALAYHKLLRSEQSWGCMMIDRDDQQHGHLVTLFQQGAGNPLISLNDRIKFYGMTSDNASHLSSAVDIALGGFRFCVNAAVRDANSDKASPTVRAIFEPISRLLWGVEEGPVRRIGGYGFHARPNSVRKSEFAAKYTDLRQKLSAFALTPEEQDAT